MRIRHAPADHVCTFCAIATGSDGPRTKQTHVVARSDDMTAFVASHWWPGNPGHVLVIPNRHVENIYEFPDELSEPLMVMTRRSLSR